MRALVAPRSGVSLRADASSAGGDHADWELTVYTIEGRLRLRLLASESDPSDTERSVERLLSAIEATPPAPP